MVDILEPQVPPNEQKDR